MMTAAAYTAGLSPRVRGNRRQAGGERGRRRSIPACAGEPVYSDNVHIAAAVYPRVCGGTGVGQSKVAPESGLSPRVRGNRLPAHFVHPGNRSIPACAGEPKANQST